MKVKTADLTDLRLDWAVAECLGATRTQLYEYSGRRMIRVSLPEGIHAPWEPSSYWGQGGPIIEREAIGIGCLGKSAIYANPWLAARTEDNTEYAGPTPLIAAMRCYVASQLGDEVEVPDELMK